MSELLVRRLTGARSGALIALQRHLLGLSGRERPTRDPVLLFAETSEQVALLGRYQSFGPGRTDAPPSNVTRRLSGGRAAALGPGVLWISVVLPALTELTAPNALPIAPSRALNRYCRGVLRGLATLGVPAFYPGQDCITVRRRPLALLSVQVTDTGQALFECMLAVNENLAQLPDLDLQCGELQPNALQATSSTTLARELGRSLDMAEVIDAIQNGYVEQSQMSCKEQPTNPLETQLLQVIEDKEINVPGWCFGGVPLPEHDMHEATSVMLGRLEVGCALQQRHFLTNVTFAGDFIATGGIIDALEKKLRLCPAEWKAIGLATDQVYNDPYRNILGIGPRQTIPNTLMQVVEPALPQPAEP